MAERVPGLPSKSTEPSPGNGEAQPMISSTSGNLRGSVSRLSTRTTRNRRTVGKALTIIVICLALIPLVDQNKILSPPSNPAGSITGDEWQSGMPTSPIFATVAQPPAAALTFSPSSPAAGYPVTLNVTSSGGTAPYTFAWTFGDGTNGTGNPAIHTFASWSLGYNVTVTIKDGTGAAIRTYIILSVKNDVPPVPKFTWTPTIVFTGETVFFDGSTSSDPDGVIVDYVWDVGEVAPQRGIGVLHTYSSPGVYE